jgi:hypothetical protein
LTGRSKKGSVQVRAKPSRSAGTTMTIIPWHKNVQRKSTLTYSVKAMAGPWTKVLDKAMAEFNRQMSQHGIKLALSKVEKGRGPHIVLETQPGNGLHGSAPSQTMRLNGVEYLDLVTIRLPATPRIDPRDSRSREVGPGVRLYILVHELIHAVGLSNDEHSSDDVFGAKALLIAKGTYLKSRKQAAEDLVQPFDGSAPMPPIRLGARTVGNLKKAWTGGEAS